MDAPARPSSSGPGAAAAAIPQSSSGREQSRAECDGRKGFHSLLIGGISTESDCAFEPDYAVPPLPVSEGMQHIRIMEGMSRSLPSSPLLTHQSISVRLQPVKKLTGKDLT